MGLAITMILLETASTLIERELSNPGLLIIFIVLGFVGTVMFLRARRRLRLIERDRDDNAGAP